jgi:hypothetical protein
LLLQQEAGFLETEEGDAEEFTARISQTQLRKCVDEESAAKVRATSVFSVNFGGRFLK